MASSRQPSLHVNKLPSEGWRRRGVFVRFAHKVLVVELRSITLTLEDRFRDAAKNPRVRSPVRLQFTLLSGGEMEAPGIEPGSSRRVTLASTSLVVTWIFVKMLAGPQAHLP